MPFGMPALNENMKGVYPPSKAGEVKNAQGALLATMFGIGNLVGTLLGGIMGSAIPSEHCLAFYP